MGMLDFFNKNNGIDGVRQCDVNEIYKLFKANDKSYIFIDVREPSEWEEGVIPGIKKISMGNIEQYLPNFAKDSNYVLVCRSGNRSRKVAEKMVMLGYHNIINFKGGMLSWYSHNLPLE